MAEPGKSEQTSFSASEKAPRLTREKLPQRIQEALFEAEVTEYPKTRRVKIPLLLENIRGEKRTMKDDEQLLKDLHLPGANAVVVRERIQNLYEYLEMSILQDKFGGDHWARRAWREPLEREPLDEKDNVDTPEPNKDENQESLEQQADRLYEQVQKTPLQDKDTRRHEADELWKVLYESVKRKNFKGPNYTQEEVSAFKKFYDMGNQLKRQRIHGVSTTIQLLANAYKREGDSVMHGEMRDFGIDIIKVVEGEKNFSEDQPAKPYDDAMPFEEKVSVVRYVEDQIINVFNKLAAIARPDSTTPELKEVSIS